MHDDSAQAQMQCSPPTPLLLTLLSAIRQGLSTKLPGCSVVYSHTILANIKKLMDDTGSCEEYLRSSYPEELQPGEDIDVFTFDNITYKVSPVEAPVVTAAAAPPSLIWQSTFATQTIVRPSGGTEHLSPKPNPLLPRQAPPPNSVKDVAFIQRNTAKMIH